jgi:hypothetical protein
MNNEELSDSVKAYLKNRDALVQLKEEKSRLPDSFGDSAGWLLYPLYAIPLSVVMVAGGPIVGPSIAIFAIIYIINGWLKDGKKLVEEEEQLAKAFRIQKRNSRKKKFFKRNENGEMVEEDSP